MSGDLRGRIRAALERAHGQAYLKLGDDDLDAYEDELVRALESVYSVDVAPRAAYAATSRIERREENGMDDEQEQRPEAARTVLVHLNVGLAEGDPRGAGEVARAVEGAIEVGSDDESLQGLEIVVALAEEI